VSKLITAIGLMSGTSLDGIDVAIVKTDGEAIVQRGGSRSFPYSPAQRSLLRDAIEDAKTLADRNARPGCLAEAEWQLTSWHAAALESFAEELSLTPAEIDVIGFHGQTVLHQPEKQLTVQLGDGKTLARRLGRPVVYDLRAADVAAGGQGAPLVPVYHRALAAKFDERPIAFLNIGGVANVTWIDKDGNLLAFDTGPGNALLNDWAMRHTGSPQDTDGNLARQGKVDEKVLDAALAFPFFDQPPPKSLDRNAFTGLSLDGLSPEDGAATLVAFTKAAIMLSHDWFPASPRRWIVCGGGRHNPAIMAALPARPIVFQTAEEAGLDGDAMEAEAWGYLAVRSLKGLPITFPDTTKAPRPITGGVLALPEKS
jgi:anhydro-N-acetylmuramic acid kinase